MKFFGIALLALLWGILSAYGRVESNGVAAIVNDKVITWQEVYVELARAEGRGLLRQDAGDQAFRVMTNALELLVDHQLILQDAKLSGIELPESFIEERVNEEIRKGGIDRLSLMQDLRAKGITYEAYRQRIREQYIAYLMERRNLRSGIVISPKRIEEYYAAHRTNYHVGDQVKLRMIVLPVPRPGVSAGVLRLAAEILGQIDAGTPFSQMAAVYSAGSQRELGGDWGWVTPFARNRTLMRGLFDAVFPLAPGQRSDILGHVEDLSQRTNRTYWIYQYNQTGQITLARQYSSEDTLIEEKKFAAPPPAGAFPEPQQFFLVQLEDKRPAHDRPLAEVQGEIEKELELKELGRMREKWIRRLRDKMYVGYLW